MRRLLPPEVLEAATLLPRWCNSWPFARKTKRGVEPPTKPPGIAGVARVVGEGYPDPTQFDPNDSHFDPKSQEDNPRWFVVDIQAVTPLKEYVSLDDIKANGKLADMAVVQRGQRLSVQPVGSAHFREVLRMGGLKGADLS